MKRLTKEQRSELPPVKWGDHVLRGVEQRTRPAFVLGAEQTRAVLAEYSRGNSSK